MQINTVDISAAKNILVGLIQLCSPILSGSFPDVFLERGEKR
jgi:hypothetical protein